MQGNGMKMLVVSLFCVAIAEYLFLGILKRFIELTSREAASPKLGSFISMGSGEGLLGCVTIWQRNREGTGQCAEETKRMEWPCFITHVERTNSLPKTSTNSFQR